MSSNATPREYVVTLRLQALGRPPSLQDPIERLEITAYDHIEAVCLAELFLHSRYGDLRDLGVQPHLVYVEPVSPQALLRSAALVQDLWLRLMPIAGHA